VRQMGDRLSDAWEKKWHASQIEGKWEALMREEKEEEVPSRFPLIAPPTVERRSPKQPKSIILAVRCSNHVPAFAAGPSDCAAPDEGDGQGAA